jgi:hypothetical protein
MAYSPHYTILHFLTSNFIHDALIHQTHFITCLLTNWVIESSKTIGYPSQFLNIKNTQFTFSV